MWNTDLKKIFQLNHLTKNIQKCVHRQLICVSFPQVFQYFSSINNLKIIDQAYHSHQATRSFLQNLSIDLQYKCTPPHNSHCNSHHEQVDCTSFDIHYCRTAKKPHCLQKNLKWVPQKFHFSLSYGNIYANCISFWTKGSTNYNEQPRRTKTVQKAMDRLIISSTFRSLSCQTRATTSSDGQVLMSLGFEHVEYIACVLFEYASYEETGQVAN